MAKLNKNKYQIIGELARRRGFFWPSYELYGGVSGFLTYGPLGTVLKQRIEAEFRRFFVKPLNIVEMESSIVTPAKIFEASGHVKAFREPMVECLKCEKKFRADHLLQEQAKLSDTETEKLGLQAITKEVARRNVKCPECGAQLGKAKYFMTMFRTKIGPYSDAIGYGRPEAAQGAFVEFKRLYETSRQKLPFGIAQIGHALRNEISPRQGPIRLREFTIADIEFFIDPQSPQCPLLSEVEEENLQLLPAIQKQRGTKETLLVTAKEALRSGLIETEWQAYFMILAKHFLSKLGVPDEKQRFVEKLEWERAHYSEQGYDQEIYLDGLGWTEVSGHNYRTDYDLKHHMKSSGVDLRVFKEREQPGLSSTVTIKPVRGKIGLSFKENAPEVIDLLSEASVTEVQNSLKEKGYFMAGAFRILPVHVNFVSQKMEKTGRRFIPHVVEPSFGIDRLVYVSLEYAYGSLKGRTLLKLPRELAPVQVGVFPLVSKDGLTERAKLLCEMLIKEDLEAACDEAGSIGRRYARADEAGTPLCLTVDYQTLEDNTVTIRDRDSREQVRLRISELPESLKGYFSRKVEFENFV